MNIKKDMLDLEAYQSAKLCAQILQALPEGTPNRIASFALMNAASLIIARMPASSVAQAPGTLSGLINTAIKTGMTTEMYKDALNEQTRN